MLEALWLASSKACCCKCSKEVVDHVDAAKRRLNALRGPLTHVRSKAHAFSVDMDIGCIKVELGARKRTGGAPKRTKLCVGAVVVGKLGATHLAEAILGNALGRQMQVLANPKGDYLGSRRLSTHGHAHRDRVVAIYDKCCCGRGRESVDNDILDVVDLACTVELIAKEIEQNKVARAQGRQDVDGRELVALHNRPIGAVPRQHSRRNTREHIGAQAIAQYCVSCALNTRGNDVVRGCLAVGSAYNDGAF